MSDYSELLNRAEKLRIEKENALNAINAIENDIDSRLYYHLKKEIKDFYTKEFAFIQIEAKDLVDWGG